MIGAILIQKAESVSAGLSSSGGLFPVRGAKSVLTRATAILATIFFSTSMTLAVLIQYDAELAKRSHVSRKKDGTASGKKVGENSDGTTKKATQHDPQRDKSITAPKEGDIVPPTENIIENMPGVARPGEKQKDPSPAVKERNKRVPRK